MTLPTPGLDLPTEPGVWMHNGRARLVSLHPDSGDFIAQWPNEGGRGVSTCYMLPRGGWLKATAATPADPLRQKLQELLVAYPDEPDVLICKSELESLLSAPQADQPTVEAARPVSPPARELPRVNGRECHIKRYDNYHWYITDGQPHGNSDYLHHDGEWRVHCEGFHSGGESGGFWSSKEEAAEFIRQHAAQPVSPAAHADIKEPCGKSGCEKPAKHRVNGSLTYYACDAHREEIEQLCESEDRLTPASPAEQGDGQTLLSKVARILAPIAHSHPWMRRAVEEVIALLPSDAAMEELARKEVAEGKCRSTSEIVAELKSKCAPSQEERQSERKQQLEFPRSYYERQAAKQQQTINELREQLAAATGWLDGVYGALADAGTVRFELGGDPTGGVRELLGQRNVASGILDSIKAAIDGHAPLYHGLKAGTTPKPMKLQEQVRWLAACADELPIVRDKLIAAEQRLSAILGKDGARQTVEEKGAT